MAFSTKRALSTGAKTYATTQSLGPKVSIPVSAAAAVFDGFMGPDENINVDPFYESHERFSKSVMSDARDMSAELGAQTGARLSTRGLNDSALGDFIVGANKANIFNKAQDLISTNLRDLEHRIAIAQASRSQAIDDAETAEWDNTLDNLLKLVAGEITETGDAQTDAANRTWLNNLLQKYFPDRVPLATTQPKVSEIDQALGQLGGVDTNAKRSDSFVIPESEAGKYPGHTPMIGEALPTPERPPPQAPTTTRHEFQRTELETEYGSEMVNYWLEHLTMADLEYILDWNA